MAALHLHVRDDGDLPSIRKCDDNNTLWESGAWYVAERRAQTMKGAEIHIHRRKTEPSHIAGIIECFQRREFADPRDGRSKIRTYFIFRRIPGLEGKSAGPGDWLQNGTRWNP